MLRRLKVAQEGARTPAEAQRVPLSAWSFAGRVQEKRQYRSLETATVKAFLLKSVETVTYCAIITPDCVKGNAPHTTGIMFQCRTSSCRAPSEWTTASRTAKLQLRFRQETGTKKKKRCGEVWTAGVLHTSSVQFCVVRIYLVWHVAC